LPEGPRLALRCAEGGSRPFLLVHGLASNARLWEGVARHLAEAGHQVIAVDLRGHGESDQVTDGYHTAQCTADLAALSCELGLNGDREPVVAGQSWGGNVALALAANHGGVAGLALVDGGWRRLADRYPTFERCWAELAPPPPPGLTMAQLRDRFYLHFAEFPPAAVEAQLANFVEGPEGLAVARLSREHHKQILHSLWTDDPPSMFANVAVPTLLAVAVANQADKRPDVDLAAARISDCTTSLYVGAHHDLHAQHPDRLAGELLALAARAEMGQR
jgi:pimeloyl-ACP methyl ester carboxylesterase